MSTLPVYTVPPDYQDAQELSPSWVSDHSKKALLFTEAQPEAQTTIKIVGVSAQIISYAQGNGEGSPLLENRFTRIKKDLEEMRNEGFRARTALRVVAQTIFLIQAYTSLYNLVANNPLAPILPYDGALAPLASLVLKGDALLDNIDAWEKAKGTDKEKESLLKVIGSTASCLLHIAQFITFLYMTKISIGLQVFFSTILDSAALIDLISKEYDGNSTLRDQYEKPPVISMMV